MITISRLSQYQGQLLKNAQDPVDPQDLATKHYVDLAAVLANALIFKGVIDCSTNPNYPAADRGWVYVISVAGKIGGASGIHVDPRDLIICLDNGTPSGDQATVGSHWSIVHSNDFNTVVGPPGPVIPNDFVQWDGPTGLLIKDGGLSLDTDGNLAANSDVRISSQKAVKTYVDHQIALIPPDAPPTKRGVAFGTSHPDGISLGKIAGFFDVPFSGTITGWNLQIATGDAGHTIGIRFWKKAAGTSVPTVADSINSADLVLSTGTHIRSSSLTNFTTTAVTEGDLFAVEITSMSGTIRDFSGSLEIQPA